MILYAIKSDNQYFTLGGWSNLHRIKYWSRNIDKAHLYSTKQGAATTIGKAKKWSKRYSTVVIPKTTIVQIQVIRTEL